jgi:quercetin dioxygenase-like cupin family protein
MVTAGDALDLGPIGATFHVKKTAADTEGRALEMEWELRPHSSGTPVHIHPTATETYEVLEGSFDVYVDGDWRTMDVGERITVPAGIPHTFRNASDEVTRVFNAHEPAMDFGTFFGRMGRMVENGSVPADRMTLKTRLHLAIVMASHEEEIRSVDPPHGVMRALAAVGRLLGYRP